MTIHIALIGFGEVGQLLASDIGASGTATIVAYDRQFINPESGPASKVSELGVIQKFGAAEAAEGADIIISAVTAAETVNAAVSAAAGIAEGAWFLDLNSASPGQKTRASEIIGKAGGKYVEGAVMSPIAPRRLATPIMTGGPHAEDFTEQAHALGLVGIKPYSPKTGEASAVKMCRSVIIKGVESLLTESLLTARSLGVEKPVIDSLGDLFPGPDWNRLAAYMISRSLEHGGRRAEEMREVAKTVREAGQDPLMSTACAKRQDLAKTFAASSLEDDLPGMLDNILEQTRQARN